MTLLEMAIPLRALMPSSPSKADAEFVMTT